MAGPTFWDNPDKAQSVVQELKSLRNVVEPLKHVVAGCVDLTELLEMAEEGPSGLSEVETVLV
ncbi:MAG: peptide chain release factor 2, partial [Pirellula sp.]